MIRQLGFIAKIDACYWPLDKNDLSLLFPLCLRSLFLSQGWCGQPFILSDLFQQTYALCGREWLFALETIVKGLLLRNAEIYYERAGFSWSMATAITVNLWSFIPAMSSWEPLLWERNGGISLNTPWIIVLGSPGQFFSCPSYSNLHVICIVLVGLLSLRCFLF